MAAKTFFTQIFIYFSKPLRLLYSLVIYEIVNFLSSLFTLCYFFLSFFFLYLKSVPTCTCIYVIVHVHVHVVTVCTVVQYPMFNVRCLMYNICTRVERCARLRETRACAAVFRGNPRNCAITRKIALFRARIRVPAMRQGAR